MNQNAISGDLRHLAKKYSTKMVVIEIDDFLDDIGWTEYGFDRKRKTVPKERTLVLKGKIVDHSLREPDLPLGIDQTWRSQMEAV